MTRPAFRLISSLVAAEKSDLIGFGGLRKTEDVYDIGCVVVAEKWRNKGVGTAVVKHLIDYSPANKVYVATNVVDYFLKPGFMETSTMPEEPSRVLDIECSAHRKRGSVLMTYEKK